LKTGVRINHRLNLTMSDEAYGEEEDWEDEGEPQGPGMPLIAFDWDGVGMGAFLEKVDSLAADAPPPPPTMQAIIPADTHWAARCDLLKSALLTTVQEAAQCGACFSIGLNGDMAQFARAHYHLAKLEFNDPWFVAVLKAGKPLERPLASLILVFANGSSVAVGIKSQLWQ
jgi:hypothetical protein